jgi:hypothetical protein
MNARALTARPLLIGLLLALGGRCAVAADAPQAEAPPAGAVAAPQAAAAAEAPPAAAVAAPKCEPVAVPQAEPAQKKGPEMSPGARILGDPNHPDFPAAGSFKPDPPFGPYSAQDEQDVYGKKYLNRTTNPPIQEGVRLYDRGAYEPPATWLGAKNPIGYHFMGYGDLRVAGATNDNGGPPVNGKTDQSRIAGRLNLDLDLAFTSTERIHAFFRPVDQRNQFTRYEIGGGVKDKFVQEFNSKPTTLFFEGDAGQMLAGLSGRPSAFAVPIAAGLVPISTQNGIWIEDAFTGLAAGISARNSKALDISNFDLTFFTGLDRVLTDAVGPGHGKARVYGLAGFFDTLQGYVELGYGYLDADQGDLSYHNATAAYSGRYWDKISNSIRLIGNFGQKATVKTANGVLVLVENSLVTHHPLNLPQNFVPYLNLFAGFDTPQSLARAADAGGVLRNTGINFQTDGLTGYPTLDAKGHDSWGGALGVEYLFGLDRQIVVEGSAVQRMRNNTQGDQYALGASFQQPLTNALILRLDAMRGWIQGQKDIFGARAEIRLKF